MRFQIVTFSVFRCESLDSLQVHAVIKMEVVQIL